jgi:hypothetical protein
MEVIRREKQAGIHPDSDVDTYMKVNCDACLRHSQKIGLHIVEVLCQKKIHVSEARGFFVFFQIDLQRKLSYLICMFKYATANIFIHPPISSDSVNVLLT